MPVGFSPNREGAAHSIERQDVLLLRGTSIYDAKVGTIDTRICVRANGSTDRAMWLRYPKHVDALGLNAEFHLWTYRLSEEEVDSIRGLLAVVHRQFVGVEPQLEGNDVGDSLTFWADNERFVAYLLRPPDPRRQHSDDQIAAFTNACSQIYKLVPQPTTIVPDWFRRPT